MQTISHLTKGGRFRQAADREKEIGQIYLQELQELRKACQSFERAAEWYANEDATAQVSLILIRWHMLKHLIERRTRATRTQQICMPNLKSINTLSLYTSGWRMLRSRRRLRSTALRNIG